MKIVVCKTCYPHVSPYKHPADTIVIGKASECGCKRCDLHKQECQLCGEKTHDPQRCPRCGKVVCPGCYNFHYPLCQECLDTIQLAHEIQQDKILERQELEDFEGLESDGMDEQRSEY